MLGIFDYLWRLLPANPILLRVVQTGGKRKRDLFIRCIYLGLLVAVVLFSVGNGVGTSLADLAKGSASIFQTMSYLQLALVTLLAPVFTAGAITQERDSQTYDILLATPLTNGQIVLGSLLSRLFFVMALLVSGIPIFSITQIFGGVLISDIVLSFLLALATALVTGAMAMAIATLKVGTRRTVFTFAMGLMVYLGGTFMLDQVKFFHLPCTDASGAAFLSQTSWFTGLNPFLALRAIFGGADYHPPLDGTLPARIGNSSVLSWYWTSPYSFYVAAMIAISFVLVLPSIVLLRRLAQSTRSPQLALLSWLHLARTGERKARTVWNNPIAWREARTKGSAARAVFLRWGFIVAGLGGTLVLLVFHSTSLKPAQWIEHGDFDVTNQVLYVHKPAVDPSDPPVVDTIKIDPSTAVKVNGEDTPFKETSLDGKYAVQKITVSSTANATPIATEIDLIDWPRQLPASDTRQWLSSAAILEFAIILLILTNAAASTVTREKEDGTLDLLLSTPITSHYYIWGKLRGLVSFVIPLIAIPVLSALLFVIHDILRWSVGRDSNFEWIVAPETLLLLPAILVAVSAVAAILGMQMSLRMRTTVRAVMASIGIIALVAIGLGGCGLSLIGRASSGTSGNGMFALAVGAFSPFTLITLLMDPQSLDPADYSVFSGSPGGARLTVAIGAAAALLTFGFLINYMYKSMVRNFDMTIRKQSR
jgi:ABC-type transport system involved in multi-copper enzyme maturation permease subunit